VNWLFSVTDFTDIAIMFPVNIPEIDKRCVVSYSELSEMKKSLVGVKSFNCQEKKISSFDLREDLEKICEIL
jgi:competence protein ComGF